ncbi:MAG: glutathione transport system permease protein [Mycobacteriales bacterium]|jgi:peptide/nickel transport system permease protein
MTTVQQFESSSTSTIVEPPSTVEREFTVKSRSQREQIIRRFLHNRIAMTAVVVYLLIQLAAFVGPLFYRWSYFDLDKTALSQPPGSPGHILGTQDIGRDLLAMMMRGVQRSTYICVLFVLLAGTLGVLVGSVAGYFGRLVDNLLMRFVDLVLTIPNLVVIIVVASKFPSTRSAVGVAIFIAAFGWMDLARIVRSTFLSLREREFVEAAHALGASNRRIIFKHLIPNSLGSIIVWATLGAATSVILEASLTYIGYGVQGNDTSLGRLVSEGVSAADTRPWLFYFPGLALMIIVMSINLIGDGIRDAFDPSQTRVRA